MLSLEKSLEELAENELLRRRRSVKLLEEGWVEIDGVPVRNFASNDYLNLAQDPRVIHTATDVASQGVGAKASALVCGRTQSQVRLEESLAAFERTEAALVFPSGFAANLGTLTALIQAEDVVFCERFNHASLVDGCRLSGARLRVFRSENLDRLESELKKVPHNTKKWIVTDGVFSMDGRLAPLDQLCEIGEKYDASLVVDEAHGTGVFGENGRGACEHFGVEQRVAVRIGTLSKAIGTLGGFVAGSQSLIDWLWNSARTQVYSTALPPAVCAAASTSLEILQAEPERRSKLWKCSDILREELKRFELPVANESTGPIIPIVLGDPSWTLAAARRLEHENFLVSGIRPPTVPTGTSRLRVSMTAAFDETDARALGVALARAVGEQVMIQAAHPLDR